MGFFVDRVAIVMVFLRVLRSCPVNIISRVFDIRLSVGSERGQPNIRAGFCPTCTRELTM